MPDTIVFCTNDSKTKIDFLFQPLTKDQLQKVIARLRKFTIQDEESTYYLCVMKLIQSYSDSDIDDKLYDEVRALLSAGFILFRYYDEGKGYQTRTLSGLVSSKTYLDSWISNPAKGGIHPASLFATNILKDDKNNLPLRYLSYCRSPFCSLMSLNRSETGVYVHHLFSTLKTFTKQLPDNGPLTYVGFASGQFGRDALRLDLLNSFMIRQHKRATSITLIFVDPMYSKLNFVVSRKSLDLKSKADIEIIEKSVVDITNFVKNIFNITVNVYLYSSFKGVINDMNHKSLDPTIMCAEDFFKEDVEQTGVNEADCLRTTMTAHLADKHPFEAFLAYKQRSNHTLHIESALNLPGKEICIQTPNPNRRVST